MRAIHGKDWWWYHPVADYVVGIFDQVGLLAAIVKQRPKIKKTELPKPTLRPWDKTKEKTVLKVKAQPLDALKKRLGWE